MQPGSALIGCSLLEIGYPGHVVAGEISAEWKTGQGALAFTGANGSGKSTFLKTCLGLLRPRKGSLSILDTATGSRNFRQMLKSTAWVPQQRMGGSLRLTVRELIALGLVPKTGPLPNRNSNDSIAIEEALQACGIANLANQAIEDLSGGQYQRASIARAIVAKPKLLLLDEPTTFLDGDSRKSILGLLATLANHDGLSLALVSHDPELISLCTCFWLFAQGTMQVVDKAEALSRCS